MDQGVHVIDLARWFLSSEPNKVKSFTSNKYWESGVEDNAFVLLKNKDKQTASLHVSITEWSPTFLMEVVGTKGYCKISGFGKKYDDGETLTTGALDKNHKISKQYKKYKVVPFDSVRKELDCFVRSIKKKKNMGPSGADGVGVLEIVKKAYKNE